MKAVKNLKDEILELLKTNEVVRIPASEEEYLTIAYQLPFKVEYHECEIITMGLVTFTHETLVGTILGLFYKYFSEREELTFLGSNSGVQIPKFEGGYYMPDVLVVKGEPIFKKNSTAVILNPYIIVEVLSPATNKFDLESKLPEYKHLESLKQIIFVNQKKVSISSYIRTEKPNVWINQDFHSIEDSLIVEDTEISLTAIYKKIKF
jgi:Uma2 family endonuclease